MRLQIHSGKGRQGRSFAKAALAFRNTVKIAQNIVTLSYSQMLKPNFGPFYCTM